MARLGQDHTIVRVRLSTDDRKKLEEISDALKLSLSEVIRRLIRGQA